MQGGNRPRLSSCAVMSVMQHWRGAQAHQMPGLIKQPNIFPGRMKRPLYKFSLGASRRPQIFSLGAHLFRLVLYHSLVSPVRAQGPPLFPLAWAECLRVNLGLSLFCTWNPRTSSGGSPFKSQTQSPQLYTSHHSIQALLVCDLGCWINGPITPKHWELGLNLWSVGGQTFGH